MKKWVLLSIFFSVNYKEPKLLAFSNDTDDEWTALRWRRKEIIDALILNI